MKWTIEIDDNSEHEYVNSLTAFKIFRRIYDFNGTKLDKINKFIDQLENKPEKLEIPRIHGKSEDSILLAIKQKNGLTIKELEKITGYSYGAINTKLIKLKREGKVERSAIMPYVYYIKGENTDLKEAIPTGTKVSIMT